MTNNTKDQPADAGNAPENVSVAGSIRFGDHAKDNVIGQKPIDTGGGAFAGRDQWNVNIRLGAYEGEASKDDAEARVIYLRVLASRSGDIPLSGLDRDADDAAARYRPLGLERVYIGLDTQTTVSAKAVQEALASGKPLKTAGRNLEQAKDSRPLAAWEAVVLQRRLVLLGAPGSGKSTLVNRLCLALARNEWRDLEDWPAMRCWKSVRSESSGIRRAARPCKGCGNGSLIWWNRGNWTRGSGPRLARCWGPWATRASTSMRFSGGVVPGGFWVLKCWVLMALISGGKGYGEGG